MKKLMVRSNLASEAIWGPKWPPPIAAAGLLGPTFRNYLSGFLIPFEMCCLFFSCSVVVESDDSSGDAAEAAQVSELSSAADAPPRDEPHAAAASARATDSHRLVGGKYFTTKTDPQF